MRERRGAAPQRCGAWRARQDSRLLPIDIAKLRFIPMVGGGKIVCAALLRFMKKRVPNCVDSRQYGGEFGSFVFHELAHLQCKK
ncbi:MAG: hypothetical protein DMG39_00390 [Acidobacteria bacterium]|nr:MAG: hypothetical protein DMG39_00390 [Acidobacteriota bacterium]